MFLANHFIWYQGNKNNKFISMLVHKEKIKYLLTSNNVAQSVTFFAIGPRWSTVISTGMAPV